MKGKIFLSLLLLCGILLAGGAFFRYGMLFFVPDPMEKLEKDPPNITYRDRDGSLLYLERNKEGLWRFDIPLSQVPSHTIKALLAAEDYGFFHHNGVDYKALSRAIKQNFFHRRRISGASTITMQLAGMTLPGRHNIFWKCRQMWGAWKLEKLYSKEKILTEYLNRIPFGGRFHGLECAALYYFGVPAKELTPPQGALLCGLPQRPNFFRPDRHRKRALKRMNLVLGMMYERGLISREEMEKFQKDHALNFRNFQVPAEFQQYASGGLFRHAISAYRKEQMIRKENHLSIHRELTERVHRILSTELARHPGVKSFAALLTENSTGKILVYLGSNDFSNPEGGEMDMVKLPREAGSSLKPFLYGEGIEGGLLTGATILNDSPLRFGSYAPGNYDDLHYGKISASRALATSLNTPVIRLASRLGVKRIESLLVQAGFTSFIPRGGKTTPGLTIALGCGGCSLRELVNGYRLLANKGFLSPLTLSGTPNGKNLPGKKVFSPGTCALVSSMLRTIPLGLDAPDCAWKTGTSSNNKDAWAFIYTPTHTLGVWFGNPSGSRSSSLVGAGIALPAAREIISSFRQMESSFSDSWKEMELLLEERSLCRKSGLTPRRGCKTKFMAKAVPGIPLPYCKGCSEKNITVAILSPLPGEYIMEEGKNSIELPFEAAESPGMRRILFINGEPAPFKKSFLTFREEGIYTLKLLLLPRDEISGMQPVTSSPVKISIRKWKNK